MARRILAVLLLAMAAGQLSDLTGFVDILETYELGGRTTAWSLAIARGLAVDNCGCFGVHLAQPLRWWILLEDAEFVALAWWVRRKDSPPDPAPSRPDDVPGASLGRGQRRPSHGQAQVVGR